jgi:hypothetical protein
MDKLYKPLFVRLVKEGMAQHFPAFQPVKVVRTQANADVFVGTQLYCYPARPDHTTWLTWEPGPGVERRFAVLVGWSPSPGVLPAHPEHDRRIYSLRGPSRQLHAGSLLLEQILGHSAMGGFEIPTPWDQLYKLKPTTPQAEQKRVMQIAAAEAAALSMENRLAAVRRVTHEAFSHLLRVVPSFLTPAKPSDA